MPRRSLRDLIQSDIEHFGAAGTLYDLALRCINRVALAKVFKVLAITAVQREFLELPAEFHSEFLSARQLRQYSRDPQCDLAADFVEEAVAGGDQCYAVLHGATLVTYSWYSTRPTIASDGLTINISPEYVYGYKGYTHPRYRGRHLHAIEVSRAIQEYLNRGFRGSVAYVESHNFASLKSCYRTGHRDVGRAFVVGLCRRCLVLADRGCREFGVSFRPLRTQDLNVADSRDGGAPQRVVATADA